MKVSSIKIKKYLQFKDIDIDLTYPIGHEKAGKPLEKVCFIGQSGTGKTTLLRLLKYFISMNSSIGQNININPIIEKMVEMKLIFKNYSFIRTTNSKDGFIISDSKLNNVFIENKKLISFRDSYLEKLKPYLINFPAELVFDTSPVDAKREIEEATTKDTTDKEKTLSQLTPESIVDFAFDDASKTWDLVLKDIKEYQAKLLEWGTKMAAIATHKNHNIKEIQKINKDYSEWIEKNPNPLEILAEKCLDPILKKFGLRVKVDMDYQTILNLGNILLQTMDGKEVHRNFWSTGTKQIYSVATPLYELSPQNAVILIDEPERSLYPDVQKMVVDYYTGLTKDCQFFFATHSPIIASSFDPWEIIELKFDKQNEFVHLEKNYKGERHIDNFDFYPKYLRWDRILMKVFELEEEGNSHYRDEALIELAEIKRELNKLESKSPRIQSVRYKKLADEYITKAKKLGWNEKN